MNSLSDEHKEIEKYLEQSHGHTVSILHLKTFKGGATMFDQHEIPLSNYLRTYTILRLTVPERFYRLFTLL